MSRVALSNVQGKQGAGFDHFFKTKPRNDILKFSTEIFSVFRQKTEIIKSAIHPHSLINSLTHAHALTRTRAHTPSPHTHAHTCANTHKHTHKGTEMHTRTHTHFFQIKHASDFSLNNNFIFK